MINNLTNDMIRLAEEISALRHNRAVLSGDLVIARTNLGNATAETIAGFKHHRQEMSEKMKAQLSEARANREHTMAEMIAGFKRNRQEMGEKTRAELAECISGVKQSVEGLRNSVTALRAEFASDIMGAHAAWSGSAAKANIRQ